ncbi:hypothetical protein EYF80_029605 [Liparis tanakae]|uniref:Uncharacterized protein n=1 Tax=Liparis tanakae TaxID=230148 RepID=A0A4Z2H5H2_9TELE|nr:hypothetical protein EYF80_029605 [Liparis tanakae]
MTSVVPYQVQYCTYFLSVSAVLYLLPETVEFDLQGLQETPSLAELTLGRTQSLGVSFDL